jgi:hypothetical protein
MGAHKKRMGKVILGLMLLYGAASLAHFTHNAEFLQDYPNMPSWLSRREIYVAWIVVAVIGISGYLAWRRGHAFLGLSLIAVYAAIGFDSLAHYAVAPFDGHGLTMHVTIGVELCAAALLLAVVVGYMAKLRAARPKSA